MWGRSTACGQVLRPTTIGVANKTLPCGTPVKFVWHGHSIVAPVIDRGPYIKGRAWDLTSAAAKRWNSKASAGSSTRSRSNTPPRTSSSASAHRR